MDINLLKQLSYQNFAGSGDVTINFNDGLTEITGPNGSGKTRVLKAFNFLLYGKNESDRSDFSIKNTKDLLLNRQDSVVSGIWSKNGSDIALKRIYREKWQKKHGTTESVFVGNETAFFYNEVPCSKSEYEDKIKSLVEESLFKLLTNVGYFNKMPWQKQREQLFKLAPEVSDSDIALKDKSFQELLALLTNGKTLEDLKKEIKANIKKISDEIKFIPSRIDEVLKGMPADDQFDEIAAEMSKLKGQLATIELAISNESEQINLKNKARTTAVTEINTLKSERQQIEYLVKGDLDRAGYELVNKKQKCRSDIDSVEDKIRRSGTEVKSLEESLTALKSSLEQIGAQWDSVNEESYKEESGDFTCNKCGQQMTGEAYSAKKEELKANFIENRNKRLADLNNTGVTTKGNLKDAESRIAAGNEFIAGQELKLTELKNDFLELNKQETTEKPTLEGKLAENSRYSELTLLIADKEDRLAEPEPGGTAALVLQKKNIDESIAFLNTKLSKKGERERALARIEELKSSESSLSQSQASLEKTDHTIKKFEEAKVDSVTDAINSKFNYVTWKLFDVLNDQSLVPTCEALCSGVNYSDTNSASKVIASLDIINTLQQFYGILAPIIIDGAEAIEGHNIPKMNSQLIILSVAGGEFTVS